MNSETNSKSSSSSSSPSLPLQTRLKIAFLSTLTNISRRSNGTVNRRLLSLLDPPTQPSSKPTDPVRSTDIPVDPTRNLWFRLYTPASIDNNQNLPVIVFFHGGGFALASPATWAYNSLCIRLAHELPATIISVNYRLSPEHRCPAQYDDGFDILRFLDTSNNLELRNLENCILAGDSAGGNIAHHVAVRWANAEKWRRVRILSLFLMQPFFGGEERTSAELRLAGAPMASIERDDWLWKAFLPEGEDRDCESVNVFGPRGLPELPERFPGTLGVVVGEFDALLDWQRRYCEGLERRGRVVRLVVYEKGIHGFYMFPEIEESRLMIEEMRRFVEESLVKKKGDQL